MRPEQIATMPKGVALMIHPGQPPALVDLIPYTRRPYAEAVLADRDRVTAHLRGRIASDAADRSDTKW